MSTTSSNAGGGAPGNYMLGPGEIASLMSISRRSFDRLRSQWEMPPPDFERGKLIRWWPETIYRWLGRSEEDERNAT